MRRQDGAEGDGPSLPHREPHVLRSGPKLGSGPSLHTAHHPVIWMQAVPRKRAGNGEAAGFGQEQFLEGGWELSCQPGEPTVGIWLEQHGIYHCSSCQFSQMQRNRVFIEYAYIIHNLLAGPVIYEGKFTQRSRRNPTLAHRAPSQPPDLSNTFWKLSADTVQRP